MLAACDIYGLFYVPKIGDGAMPDIEFIRSEIERLRHHEQTALEQTFMLEGSLEDAEGSVGAGDFVWRYGGAANHSPAPAAPRKAKAGSFRRTTRGRKRPHPGV
jgi:hypothetical protein